MVKVFSVESQQQLRSARVGSLPLASMALLPPLPSHCYPSVLLGSSDDYVWLYSPDFGRCLSKMHAHDDTVSCIQVSQWGADTCLFTASWDGSVKQWSMAHSPFLSASPFASFSSSSPHSHGGSDTLVHPPPLAELNQHDAPITSLQVAIPATSAWPLAASGSANGAVLLWDMRAPPSASVPWSCRLSPLTTTTAPTSPLAVTGLVFSYGGLHVTAADSTGGLRVLEMRMGGAELASQHCPGGGLTCCQPLGDQSVLAGRVSHSRSGQPIHSTLMRLLLLLPSPPRILMVPQTEQAPQGSSLVPLSPLLFPLIWPPPSRLSSTVGHASASHCLCPVEVPHLPSHHNPQYYSLSHCSHTSLPSLPGAVLRWDRRAPSSAYISPISSITLPPFLPHTSLPSPRRCAAVGQASALRGLCPLEEPPLPSHQHHHSKTLSHFSSRTPPSPFQALCCCGTCVRPFFLCPL
ncbi:unnamed protein product [Closterium sp. NIES-65]|nr:unnamed protein product [Closterium sp. NIES-65]